ncbi:MAG: flagellar basal body P-ring formation chaperone FlgA [Deltaproteobacteria bacterium]|nr:flagellar basal body P-ring formation chaperone FlgA [Deltaproteobacteria bacterium]
MKRFFNFNKIISPILLVVIAMMLAVAAPASGTGMLTPERVLTALQRHAVDQGPWKAENIEVRVLPFQPVPLPPGTSTLRILRPLNGITPGLHNFLVAAVVGGKEQARVWVKADVRVFEEVVVSSQPLTFNEVVKDRDVRLERRDISGLHARPYHRIDDAVGQQAVRSIAVNETLTQRSLERPTVMRRGSAIVLVYETGSLRVETPGVAEENGKTGDLIQVKNPASGKLLRGIVLDARMVRVN